MSEQKPLFADLEASARKQKRAVPDWKRERHVSRAESHATLQDRFDEWIEQNPTIVDLFLRYAREAMAQGMRHYGIGAITERVRWHVRVETKGDPDFKLNNNYRSRLARLLVMRDPRLKELFEFRKLRA